VFFDKRVKERYSLINARKVMYFVSILCQALDVHSSDYCAWLKEPLSQRDYQNKRLST
jgi:hypothetical protein